MSLDFPPVFTLCSQDSDVSALLTDSNGKTRVYAFGFVPERPQLPYVVWQVIFGGPDNCLADAPESDDFTVQVSCYGKSIGDARQVAGAVRNALQVEGYINNYQGDDYDATARIYSVGFDWQTRVQRP